MAIIDDIAKLRVLAAQDAAGDKDAHSELLKTIRSLQLAVETPHETIARVNHQILHNVCSRVALESGLFQALVANEKKPLTAEQLASQTGTNELMIVRVMRILTTIGLCDEVGPHTYAANRVTIFKMQEGSIGGECRLFDLGFKMGSKLVEYMRGPGINQFADVPGEPTLFEYVFGSNSVFDFMENHPEHKKWFDAYMVAKRNLDGPAWFEIFPASTQLDTEGRDVPLVVDVGGGTGHEMARFRTKYPGTKNRLVVQDLSSTFAAAKELPVGVETMAYDFFRPQPIKGARAYFMHNVLHDWSDKKATEILANIVDAMDPDYSTLLIDEFVLPSVDADLRSSQLDILMWMNTAGMERSVAQWTNLLDGVGLEIAKIWQTETSDESVIEARKIKQS